MSQPIYKRILLKLSGEALQGDEGFGIDPSILDRMALEIKELIEMGVEVGVVLGGGNLFRGAKLAKAGMNRVVGDHMGDACNGDEWLGNARCASSCRCECKINVCFPIKWDLRHL